MDEFKTKRLLCALGEVDALLRVRSEEGVQELIDARLAEFASISGRTALDLFVRWRRSGSPTRDPRPRRMQPVDDTPPPRARNRFGHLSI